MVSIPVVRLILAVLMIPHHQAYGRKVVVLGDSYASGTGANGSGSYDGGGCYRSNNSWGNRAANALNADTVVNVACFGATTTEVPAQAAAAVDASTDIVILGTGGNDLSFGDIVRECFATTIRDRSTCLSYMNGVSSGLTPLQNNLRAALGSIYTQNNDAIVVLVAYPHIILDADYTATCCGFNPPNRDIINGLRSLGLQVDNAQRAAVNEANAAAGKTYVYFYDDTKTLFNGREPHPDNDIDNPNRWIYEIWLFSNRFLSFHLNPTGHSQLGAALAPFIRSLLPPTHAPTNIPTDIPTPSPTKFPSHAPTNIPTDIPIPSPTKFPSLDPTPFPVSAPTGDGGETEPNSCFSELATVQVEHAAEPVAMKDLRIGDSVLTSHGYQQVFAFGHRHKTQSALFLKIRTTAISKDLEITPEHMIYVHGKEKPVRAGVIKVGDVLIRIVGPGASSTSTTLVTEVAIVERMGLYAPLTKAGTVVVNELLASNYVSVQQGHEAVQLGKTSSISWFHQADAVHLMLAPLRLVCQSVSTSFCGEAYHGKDDGMHHYVSWGLELVRWCDNQSAGLQVLIGCVLFVVLAMVFILEHVLDRKYGFALFLHFVLCLVALQKVPMSLKANKY